MIKKTLMAATAVTLVLSTTAPAQAFDILGFFGLSGEKEAVESAATATEATASTAVEAATSATEASVVDTATSAVSDTVSGTTEGAASLLSKGVEAVTPETSIVDSAASAVTGTTEGAAGLLSKGVDAVAGEGTADVLTGKTNPVIALAVQQLGIPAEYTSQIQALYDNFKGTGAVTADDVSGQSGLSSWLGGQEGMSAASLATGLTGLFSSAK